jgi:DNA-binding NarL/FixJ family response regulator
MKRLIIVADHAFVAHAIRQALRQTAGFQIVGFVDGKAQVTASLLQTRPDVVLVDEMRDGGHALVRLREAAAVLPDAKKLLLTLRMDESWLEDAFQAGADAVVCKSVHQMCLGTLLREVAHDNVVNRPRQRRYREADERWSLTARELEILRLVAEGQTNGQIARSLWVTEQTVKFHLSNTYRKLGVANRTEASRFAHVNGLLEPRAPEPVAIRRAA